MDKDKDKKRNYYSNCLVELKKQGVNVNYLLDGLRGAILEDINDESMTISEFKQRWNEVFKLEQ